jgi:signal transduction histidine kinase
MTRSGRLSAGVRFRTTLFATAVVAVALAVGLIALLLLARSAFETAIENAAIARAESIAAVAASGTLGEQLPASDDVIAAQLIAPDGTVLAWSPGLDGFEPVSNLALQPGERDVYRDRTLTNRLERQLGFDFEGPTLVVVLGTETPDGPAQLVVAASLDTEDTLDVLLEILGWSFPAVLVVVGAVTWWGTGRALRPVEAMRQEADQISHSDLHRRLPVPETDDEVRRLAVTMNEMLERLEASAAQHYQFVADASHELKSPVAAIRTMLEVARANPSRVEFEQLIEDLLHEDLRLEMLVGDLLTLARHDERGLTIRASDVDLDDLIRSESAMVMTAQSAPIDLGEVDPVRLHADPDRLRQLLRNLLDNSVRHARAGVWVISRTEGDEAVLLVSNDGDPIPPEQRQRIFERFVRLDDARGRDDGGTGLGLPVVQAITHAHGGRVAVIDPLHGGATFEVRLPARAYSPAGSALSE